MKKFDISFSRKKSKVSEAEALNSICEKKGVTADQLTAAHRDNVWYWEPIDGINATPGKTANANAETVKIAKADFPDRDAAERAAYPQLKTFQGNLKLVEQDDENWTFGKVRG
jgi:hypothetical protein